MAAGIAAVDDAHGELLSDYTRAFAAETNAPGLGFYEGLELEGATVGSGRPDLRARRRAAVPDDGDRRLRRRRARTSAAWRWAAATSATTSSEQ